MLAFNYTPQATIRIGAVADKSDALNLDFSALENLEYKINAVVATADHPWGNARRHATILRIGFGQGRSITLRLCWTVDLAHAALDELFKVFILKLFIALKGNPVNRGIFGHTDHKTIALGNQLGTLEKTAGQNSLIGIVKLTCRHRLVAGDPGVRQNRRGLDALIAFDRHRRKPIGLCLRLPGACHHCKHKKNRPECGLDAYQERKELLARRPVNFKMFHCSNPVRHPIEDVSSASVWPCQNASCRPKCRYQRAATNPAQAKAITSVVTYNSKSALTFTRTPKPR